MNFQLVLHIQQRSIKCIIPVWQIIQGSEESRIKSKHLDYCCIRGAEKSVQDKQTKTLKGEHRQMGDTVSTDAGARCAYLRGEGPM